MAPQGDTRAKRFEYARLRAAIRKGRGAMNPREMTEELVKAGAPKAAGNYYWRMETERIDKIAPEWIDAIGRVAHVDGLWLSMVGGSERFAPEGYVEWLAARIAEEQAAKKKATPTRKVRIAKRATPESPGEKKKRSG